MHRVGQSTIGGGFVIQSIIPVDAQHRSSISDLRQLAELECLACRKHGADFEIEVAVARVAVFGVSIVERMSQGHGGVAEASALACQRSIERASPVVAGIEIAADSDCREHLLR